MPLNRLPNFINSNISLTGVSADYLDGIDLSTISSSLRANRNITGGGTIAFDVSGNLIWSDRFIVMSNGRGPSTAPVGYFDIYMPPAGTTITGLGGAGSRTVSASGINISGWEALYYILPTGISQITNNNNFRIVSYIADVDIPHDWVLLAIRNGDVSNQYLYLNNGIVLAAGQSNFAGLSGNMFVGASDTENYIAFRGTTGDNPGSFNHGYIGERIYSGSELSELLIFKGNDIEGASGPDRIRLLAGAHRFDTYSSPLSGSFSTVASAASTVRMTIDSTGVSLPKLNFSGGTSTISALTLADGTVSFEGTAGQLFSVSNSLTGTIFSINDISGLPSVEVTDLGIIKLNELYGQTVVGSGTPATSAQLSAIARTSATIPLAVRGASGQSVNLQEWQNSTPTTVASISNTGAITAVDLTLSGNLTVNGTTTNINTVNLVVEDKNIILGDVTSPSTTTADGGGITLLAGGSNKTFNWINATDRWTSSVGLEGSSIVRTGGTASQFLKADGSVDSSTYITGNQSITLSGDVTGSGTTAITTTLANSGATAGTYKSVTVDVKGRVTGGTNPTTLSGYGITDALSNSTTSTQSGYFGDIFLFDDSTPSHYLQITNSANLTAARILNINTNDADRTISLSGNLTVSSAATISGTNTGDQTITLTGDVTGTGTGSFATTLANSGVTAGTYRSVTVDVKGRVTGGTNPTTLSGYGITDALDTSATAQTKSGNLTVASIIRSGGTSTQFLKADGSVDSSTYLTSASTLTAGNLSGTIPSAVLANSSVFIGTTSIALNRGTGALSLTGVSIDGSAGSVAAANITGTTLASGVTASSLTSVGTLTSLTTSGAINLNYASPTIASNNASAASIFTSTVTGITIGSSTIKTTEFPADGTTSTAAVAAGYMGMPRGNNNTAITGAYTITAADAGKHLYVTTTGQTITIPANGSVAFPIGTTIIVINGNSVSTTIAITTDTLRLANSTNTGSRTLASNAMCTLLKINTTEWIASGNGLT